MAIVELSTDAANSAVSELYQPSTFAYSGQTGSNVRYFGEFTSGSYVGIAIMKGAIPTNFTGLTLYSARSADTLVFFNARTDFGAASYTNFEFLLSTGANAATQSGTATWFWAFCSDDSPATGTIYQQFIGTVGVTGSGADLIISDTNVVSGTGYSIGSLRVKVPTSWTV